MLVVKTVTVVFTILIMVLVLAAGVGATLYHWTATDQRKVQQHHDRNVAALEGDQNE